MENKKYKDLTKDELIKMCINSNLEIERLKEIVNSTDKLKQVCEKLRKKYINGKKHPIIYSVDDDGVYGAIDTCFVLALLDQIERGEL